MRKNFRDKNYICFTSDLDWAPEPAIEKTLKLFLENEIRPTIFVTHPSDMINEYENKIDLGIHPNFISPSSQGDSIEDIIEYCIKLAPDAKVFRCHRWFSCNDIYDCLLKKGFLYESNLCTSMEIVDPFIQRSGMLCLPVFFEDGAYIIKSEKIDFELVKYNFMQNGLKVINIHPMHYALNTPYFQYTRHIKDRLSRQEWNTMDVGTLTKMAYQGYGIADFINELMEFIKAESVEVITLKNAYDLCTQGDKCSE